jgi:hypothetical protein
MPSLRSLALAGAVFPLLLAAAACSSGSPASTPAPATPPPLVGGLDVSAGELTAAGGYLFWSQLDASGVTYSIQRVAQTGGTPEPLVDGIGDPGGLASDGTTLYWTDFYGGSLLAAPLAGASGAAPAVLATGLTSPRDVVVAGPVVFVVEELGFGSNRLVSVALAGGAPTTVSPESAGWLSALAGDGTAAYFVLVDDAGFCLGTSPCACRLMRYSAGDAAPRQLVELPKQLIALPQQLAFDVAVSGGNVYLDPESFADGQPNGQAITKVSTRGTSATTVAPFVGLVTGLAATPSGAVYWGDSDGLWTVPAAGGPAMQLGPAHDGFDLASDGESMFALEATLEGASIVVLNP